MDLLAKLLSGETSLGGRLVRQYGKLKASAPYALGLDATSVIAAKAGIQRVMLGLQKRAGNLKPLNPTTLDPRVRGDDRFLS